MSLIINVASTVDSIHADMSGNKVQNIRDFGNSMLLPTNSGQAFRANFIGYFANVGREIREHKRRNKVDTTF